MLISREKGIVDTEDFQLVYDGDQFVVYLNGMLFIRKHHVGSESIKIMSRWMAEKNEIPFGQLYGTYTVVVQYKQIEKIIVFSDNSCMHGFFLSENYIGSDFIEVIKKEGIREFDTVGLCEYVGLGRSGFSQRTYVKGISLSDNLTYYVVKEHKIYAKKKGIEGIDGVSVLNEPNDLFKDITYALENIPTVCALTGGFDSRAVATSLNFYGNFDCFISGENDTSPEIVQALKTAKAGNMNMLYIKPEQKKLSNDHIMQMFEKWHGYHVMFGADGFRIDYFMDYLSGKGYKVLADGSAGDMHKEFWCIQDFPFYKKRKSDSLRFLKRRMLNMSPVLGDRIIDVWKQIEAYELKEMKKINKEVNCKTYLCYGWQIDWRANSVLNSVSPDPIVYSPLQEIEMVRYSYNRVPKNFFMNTFFRSVTSAHNKSAARVATIYGTTASNEFLYMFRDIGFQFIRYGKQGLRYLLKIATGKSFFLPKINVSDTDDQLRLLDIVKKAHEWAIKERIIADNVPIDQIKQPLLDKMINLYLVSVICFMDT